MKLKIGTRRSQLALWQTNYVAGLLQQAWPDVQCEIVPFVTVGDKSQAAGKPLAAIGGKGLFTAELERALLSGDIDLAVHSLKDLPTDDPQGVTVGAVPKRADAHDVWIAPNGQTLGGISAGAIIGTSSLRRTAQLLAARPDLDIRPIRGNVDTRLKKAQSGEYDAIVLAAAGVQRLELQEHITQILPPSVMLPAPAQGALGIQCRADDEQTLGLLAVIEDRAARTEVSAERAFLATLGGGCSTPIAALATIENGTISLAGLVSSLDGATQIYVKGVGDVANHGGITLGQQLATKALEKGAEQLLNVSKN